MEISLILVLIITASFAGGTILGYWSRQSIARRRAGTIEQKIQKKVNQAKEESQQILEQAQEKANQIIKSAQKEIDQRNQDLLKTQQILLRRERLLDEKISSLEIKETEIAKESKVLKEMEERLKDLRKDAEERLEKVAKLSKEEAKKELMANVEAEFQKEISEKMKKLEKEGMEKLEERAKKILALAIERCAIPQVEEISTTTVLLKNEDVKGRIIGKEGRNIRAFEKLTGTEIIVDEAPDSVVISGFNPIRRQIAKIALEKLIQDGRIQPTRIEEKVEEAKQEISKKIKEFGEKTIQELGIIGLDEKLVQLVGRLYFRTSYGQNVLIHSTEAALIAETLANELGANSEVAKRGALFHDIGKAVDHQVKGSHVDIGIKILEKFGESEEVIKAMKSHHEEYPTETVEAILVETADAISSARPGARKDTLENYLQRLEGLENIALSFTGVEKAYAIQAGREVRIFVKPEQVDDLGSKRLARQIADKIEEELRYPGEIKVNVIRENRVIEYAR